MKLEIRRATAADRPALEKLWAEVDELHAELQPGFFRAAPRGPRFFERATAGGNQVVLLAELDGEPVGMVHVELYDTPRVPVMVPCRRAHIEDLVVAGEHRRHGVGRKLMEEAARWADGLGATQVVLTVWQGNTAAEKFYRSLGYTDLSRVMKLDLP